VIKKKEDDQMQRAEFLNPEVDIIKFEAEDVITTSGDGLDFDPNGAGGEGGSDGKTEWDDMWG
jgi:hypothetical protein